MKKTLLFASAACMAPAAAHATTTQAVPQPAGQAEPAEPDQSEAQPAGSSQLGDIVVTAQRRKQNLQDVPISISAFDGAALTNAGVQDARDLARLVPNLSFQSPFAVSGASLFIRGVGVGDMNANTTGAVGIYIDDVFIGANSGKLMNTFDVEGVEVLKGPQGTLYGRNTTGGAVRFSSRKPTNTWQFDGNALYGRFNEVRLESGVGGPIVADTLKFRVSGLYQRRDGYTYNRVTGHKLNDLDLWSARAILDWTPSDRLLVRVSVHNGENYGGARQFQHVGQGVTLDGRPNFSPAGVPLDGFGYADTDGDIDAGDYNVEGQERLSMFGASLNAQWDLGGATLTAISAYEQVNHHTLEDTDASPNDMITARYVDRPRQFSQEVRLGSDGHSKLTWVVGGFYFHDKLRTDSSYDLLRGARDPGDPAASFDPAGVGLLRFPYTQTTESWAAFGQADYAVTDRLTGTVGLRYSQDHIRFDYRAFYDEPQPIGRFDVLTSNTAKSFDDVSYRVALNYKIARSMLYVSASKGYNSGGFAGGASTDAVQLTPFRSEKLYAYETGLKTELFDRHVRLNTAAYLYNYKDLQVFVFDTSGVLPVQRKLNAGEARIYGVEADVIAEPLNGLTLNFGGSLMHSEYRKFIAIAAADYAGNRLVNAPTLAMTGGASYEFPISSGSIATKIDGTYQSRVYITPDNIPTYSVPAYALLNARVSWFSPDRKLEVAAFGRNITNKRYVNFRAPAATQDQLNYNDPGTFGIQLTAHLK